MQSYHQWSVRSAFVRAKKSGTLKFKPETVKPGWSRYLAGADVKPVVDVSDGQLVVAAQLHQDDLGLVQQTVVSFGNSAPDTKSAELRKRKKSSFQKDPSFFKYGPFQASLRFSPPFSWYIVKLQSIKSTVVIDDRKQERKMKSMGRSITRFKKKPDTQWEYIANNSEKA